MTDISTAQANVDSPVTSTDVATETTTANPATADREFLDRYSRIAREEARIRNEKKSVDSQKERLAKLEKLEKLASEDPDALLSEFGWDYHKLTERHLSGKHADPLEEIRREVNGVKKELYDKFSSEEKAKQEAALVTVLKDIRSTIDSNEELELIKLNEAYDDVWELMTDYYQEHKEWLSVEKAAEYVEKELEAQAQKFLGAKKLQRKQPEAEQTKDGNSVESGTSDDIGEHISKTLSNRMNPLPSATVKKEGMLTVNDLREMALQAAREKQ